MARFMSQIRDLSDQVGSFVFYHENCVHDFSKHGRNGPALAIAGSVKEKFPKLSSLSFELSF